jgi:N-acetylglutamate synthase-like GNAT family acetyltransferase
MNVDHIGGDDPELALALSDALLPADDLTEADRVFYRFSTDQGTVGYGGLERCGNVALLRSVVVLTEYRGMGFGTDVVEWLLGEAGRLGMLSVYLLTERAAPFFERLGFVVTDRADAPPEILRTRQATVLCPASATLLSRTVHG